jgi:hypothetical protein
MIPPNLFVRPFPSIMFISIRYFFLFRNQDQIVIPARMTDATIQIIK